MFANAIRMAVMGYHFEKVTQQQVAIDDFKQYLTSELDTFKNTIAQFAKAQGDRVGDLRADVQSLLNRVHAQYEQIHDDFRYHVHDALDAFRISVKHHLEQFFGPSYPQIEGLD